MRSGKRDPDLEVMKVDYTRALAQLIPLIMPDILFRLDSKGQPLFTDFADAIVPTEFLPGKVFGSGTMQPIDYCVAMAEGRIPPPSNLDIRTILTAGAVEHVPISYFAISDAPRRRLEGEGLSGNVVGLEGAQRTIEVLG